MTLSHSPVVADRRPIDRARIVSFVEASVDGEQELPVWGFVTKLYIRRWMFLICALVPMLLSLGSTMLTPMTWVASTEILIRYSSSESAFLQDLIPADRASLSGPVIGEILRSLPTLSETVRRYDIKEEDIYRDPSKVVLGKVFKFLHLASDHPAPAEIPGVDPKITALAEQFQSSLQESSQAGSNALGSKARPVEILGKDSPIPQSMKGDELITLTVRSFTRTKVAEMTNGLAQTLIDQYYRISAEDAHRSYEFLTTLVDKAAAEVQRLDQDQDASAPGTSGGLDAGIANAAAARDSPTIVKLTNELAALQAELLRSQQFFADDSTRIQRTDSQIENLKRLLGRQEKLEAAKQVLEQIKNRRFQAQNTENLYRSRLVPISIIEPAVTPPPSGSASAMRFVASGLTGLIIGSVLGMALIIVLGVLDQRLFTPADVERALGLPIFGWLPKLKLRREKRTTLPDIKRQAMWNADTGLLQVLSHLDAARAGGFGNIVAITSASDDDGKSVVSLLLARALARPGVSKVLLIDADPLRASLSRHFGQTGTTGMVDDGFTLYTLEETVVPSGVPNLDLLPVETVEEARRDMGSYLGRLRNLFNEASRGYDLVIVDTPAISSTSEALMCCMAANMVLLVVRSGVTRAFLIRGFLRKLREVAIRPQGVILNFRYNALPRFIDRGV